MSELLEYTATLSRHYLEQVSDRPVAAQRPSADLRRLLGGPLSAEGEPDLTVIESLAHAGEDATMASTGPRYFGFVIGGNLPAALAADWLVSTWDQNCTVYALSPLVAVIEEIVVGWLLEIAGLPATMSAGITTGCQMASFTGLAAARHRVLERAGWDVEADGLFGAPPIDVIVSDEAHYTIFMALRLLGLGGKRLRRIGTDGQGRMRIDALRAALQSGQGPCIVCAQAGNVNTGAFDPLQAIAESTQNRGAWLHVDGAFGLWAAASPGLASLTQGIERADSVATDGHKWLNVPYDCGIVFCADSAAHRAAMSLAAAYIVGSSSERDPHEFVPEESRRARAVPLYAALRSLGRRGVTELVDRCCRHARRFAQGLRAAGHEVLNDVVLNQVLVSFGDAEQTRRTIAEIQREGTCWCGGTVWQGRTAMRISVSNWRTTEEDVERSLEAMLRTAARCVSA
ncbi:MAG: aminotransferase class V-fold PLP-dependent enzyme [Steroidobacteraceae bacterium]